MDKVVSKAGGALQAMQKRTVSMRIGLIDVDGHLPNLALMKLSTFYKNLGCDVELYHDGSDYDSIFASAILTSSRPKCEELIQTFGDRITIGGTGWDVKSHLPEGVDACSADYDLYTADDIYPRIRGIMTKERRMDKAREIVNAGIGMTSRGCIRSCPFCFVPEKEGAFRHDQEIKDIINPRSKVIILHDNNLTADPDCVDKIHEIRDRNLTVDINQGCDVRLMTPEIAAALSEVHHLRSIHYAWDLMGYEDQVLRGIKVLKDFIRPYRHMCFMLCGFNTSHEEDMYRFKKILELGVDPYVMKYNQRTDDIQLNHFARWVNGRFHKKEPDFEEYGPWKKAKNMGYAQIQMNI